MKTIDKVKKKLKTWEWLNKYLGNTILAVYLPMITLYTVLIPLNFIIGFVCLIISFLTITIGGLTKAFYADDDNYKVLYQQQIAAMETVTEEKLEILTKSIENYKNDNVCVGDKKTTRRLIKELVIMRNNAEKALKEKQESEEESLSL